MGLLGQVGPKGNDGTATNTGASGPTGHTGPIGRDGSATLTGATGPTGPPAIASSSNLLSLKNSVVQTVPDSTFVKVLFDTLIII